MYDNSIAETTAPSILSLARWEKYFELCKPKVVLLILFTAIVGMLLSTPGMLPWDVMIFASLGIGLASASGAALNHLIDQRIDAMMERTRLRPLPHGDLETTSALTFAITLGIISMLVLLFLVNALTALLTFLSLIGYAIIYTVFLKRATPQNIVLGGAAGAMPPVLGWTAMTGEIHIEALLLFLIIFVWTPPHFWALAIPRRHEYAKAGIPMLPVTHGVAVTKQQILLYTIMLVAISLLPFLINMSGLLYLSGAIILGIVFLHYAIALYRNYSDQLAMKTFGYSIVYLSLLFTFLLVDHYSHLFWQIFI